MKSQKSQRGVVLLVGMVMLVLLTLMAVAALKFGTSTFSVVFNQQTRNEATRSAEQVIDLVISNTEVQMTNGVNLFGTGSNTTTVDVNGDGNADYTVVVATPVCVKRQVISQASLNFEVDDDLACARGVDQASLGVEGAGAGDSICSTVVWDVQATASDAFRTTSSTVVQGVGQRVATTRLNTVCD